MRNLIIRWLRLDERYLTAADLEAAAKPAGPSPEVIEEIWRIGMAMYADYGPCKAAAVDDPMVPNPELAKELWQIASNVYHSISPDETNPHLRHLAALPLRERRFRPDLGITPRAEGFVGPAFYELGPSYYDHADRVRQQGPLRDPERP
ncbi:hypothetical protein N7I30_13985 [Aurantimonas litoralis]|nr:hypothetical protein [Aurantimonas litoralis]